MTITPSNAAFVAAAKVAWSNVKKPEGPDDEEQQHKVVLRAMITPQDRQACWDHPRQWCEQYVQHNAGSKWHVRTAKSPNHEVSTPVYYFSDLGDAVYFALRWK